MATEFSAHPPLTPNLHDSSPLGSLMRRASSRRARNQQKPPDLELTPPRSTGSTVASAPQSPLLHTQFRNSTSTSGYEDSASMRTVSWDARSTAPSMASTVRDRGRAHESMASNYSEIESITNRYRDTWRSSGVDPSVYDPPADVPDLPTVVVSAAPEAPPEEHYDNGIPGPSKGGRVPSRVNNPSLNFSRPVGHPSDILPSEAEERKREVLMRNARYGSPQTPNFHPPSPSHSPQPSPRLGPSPLNSPAYTGPPGPPTPGPGPGSRPVSPASNAQPHPNPYPSRFPSQGPNASPIPNGAHSPIPSLSQEHLSHPGLHPRVDSSVSVYSNYSYYELPPTPTSPNGSQSATPPGSALPQSSPLSAQHYMPPTPMTPTTPATPVTPSRQRAKSNASKTKVAGPALANPQTPQDYLQLGIQYHLENKLVESAAAFEKSATLDGGCGVGMLMWGLAQRHGWGCEKNEGTGFKWLRRAAELAVGDLEKGQQLQGDMSAVKSELVLAIYEVGQSFFRGWGVQKDKEMAVQYYRVAARLGDPDAQQELAFCLLNGKGCKKDKKESAKWYRAAVQQGVSDIGLAWIYKDKYQDS